MTDPAGLLLGLYQPMLRIATRPEHDALTNEVRLRRLQAGDCLEHLTGLLHRAFSRLGEMGIPCSCVSQTPEVTRQRVERGDCFVAVSNDRVVGTITLCPPDAAADSRHYRDLSVASVRQFAVDPHFQGQGVGAALLQLAARWACRRGYERLALDTPEPAGHLLDYYHRQGFRVVETRQFSGRPYRSVVFAKSLPHPPRGAWPPTAHRPLCPLRRRGACAVALIPNRHTRPRHRR